MRYSQVFKLLIDVSFYLLIPVIFLFPGAIVYFLIFPEQQIVSNLPFSDNGAGWLTALVLLLVYAEYLMFFLGFYNLQKFAGLLLKNKIFTKSNIKSTKRIGQFFTACGLSSLVLKLIFMLFLSERNHVEFGISDPQLFLFLVIIGLFFLILSRAFEHTRQLEEENKLTI